MGDREKGGGYVREEREGMRGDFEKLRKNGER